MALGGFSIPPWLITRPTDFAQASESGLNAGLQAAHIWAAAAQEQARLQESQRAQDMDNALKQEALQQKSIYEAQALAVDKAKNQAVASLAQAKLQDTQQKAVLAAQQWTANQKRLLAEATTRQNQNQQRIDISQKNAQDLSDYRKYLENKPPARSGSIPLDVRPEYDLLKQKIAEDRAQLKTVQDNLLGNPKNKKWLDAQDKLLNHQNDLVQQQKKLLGVGSTDSDQATLDEETAALADQAAQEEEERFVVKKVDDSENEGD